MLDELHKDLKNRVCLGAYNFENGYADLLKDAAFVKDVLQAKERGNSND